MDEDRYTRITLRIPRELHAELTRKAEQASHSLNAEIVHRLRASFAQPETDSSSLWLQIRALERRNGTLQAELATHERETAAARERLAGIPESENEERLKVQDELRRAHSASYLCRMEISNLIESLDALYGLVSTEAPGAGHRGMGSIAE